jgi:ABC-2 type transport system ATP-binding protein
MSAIIEIVDLSKQYSGQGSRKAIDHLNLNIEEGDIFGFVGPNGAGKTSTIRIIATLLQASSGDVRVAGYSVRTQLRQVRKSIGYMPDFFGVYNDMLVWEYLDFFGACYNLPADQRTRLIKDLLELVDLTHRHDDPVEGLSRGMKQRLSLARTLIHDPQVLILDEPASGLDPRARVEIRQLLVELARMGKTIFFSTHILADVAEICTRVGIIEAGKLVAAGPLEELQQLLMPHRKVQITIIARPEEALTTLKAVPGVLSVTELHSNGELRLRFEIEFNGDDQALSEILASLVSKGIPVLHFNEDSRDLEEVFMRATKGLVT